MGNEPLTIEPSNEPTGQVHRVPSKRDRSELESWKSWNMNNCVMSKRECFILLIWFV